MIYSYLSMGCLLMAGIVFIIMTIQDKKKRKADIYDLSEMD